MVHGTVTSTGQPGRVGFARVGRMLVRESMAEIAKRARCGSGQHASYREKLHEHGFAILEPDPDDPLQLDGIMMSLGTPVQYKFGTKLSIEPQPESTNSQFSNRG